MDKPTSSPESTGGSPPGASPGAAGQRQQGALGGRRVSEAPPRAPSIRDSREAGGVAGPAESQPGIHSRQATAETSLPPAGISHSGARAHRRARAPEAPGHRPEGAPDLEAPVHIRKKIRLDASPGFNGLPWLTGKQNVERRILHDLLAQWLARPEPDAEREAEVDEAAGLVSRIEQDLSRAEELLRGMRTRLLTEAEWNELTFLVTQARAELPHRLDRATDMLGRLAESGSLSSEEAGSLEASLRRLVAAHEFLDAQELPWRGIVKRVEVPLGEDPTPAAAVESRVVPGTAFGSRFARGYSWEPNAELGEKILSGNVPHLAQTRLTGATGETLFCGLHRGFIGFPEFSGDTLRALPHVDLRRLVSELVVLREENESPAAFRKRVEERCLNIIVGDSLSYAATDAQDLRQGAAWRQVKESAAAALCSDPVKLQRAIDGETVDITLFDVALLISSYSSDFRPWVYHYVHQVAWKSPRQISLNLHGPDREPCRVSANATVRQFTLSVEDGDHGFTDHGGLYGGQLLGEMDSRDLGGDVRDRVEALRARVRKLGGELAAAGHGRVRSLPPGALEHRGSPQTVNRVAALQAELVRLEKNARALEQAGRQLKALWSEHNRWPTGADAYRAAARLALVAYLMGETPVLSCASGRDCNKRLDAEVKVLATVTDCRGGQVPPADFDTDAWDTARTAFLEP